MPTIAETTNQLVLSAQPILFIDTCTLLDIIRAPFRKTPGCVDSAVELLRMSVASKCNIIAASFVRSEWHKHAQDTVEELDRHLSGLDEHAREFHDACELVGVLLPFGKPSYKAAGLSAKLHELSLNLLNRAVHLSPSEETRSKATNRTLACIPPARRGGGLKDCVILEEYIELSRQLQIAGFSMKKLFCSSNTSDYHGGRKLHENLTNEFGPIGLTFTHTLHWAVNALKKA